MTEKKSIKTLLVVGSVERVGLTRCPICRRDNNRWSGGEVLTFGLDVRGVRRRIGRSMVENHWKKKLSWKELESALADCRREILGVT